MKETKKVSRRQARRRAQRRRALLTLTLVLVVALGAVGGTLAWLVDQTDAVTNTFSTSDVDIELAETTGTSYKMVPGHTITKDPKVTVKANSEKSYVFVKLEKSTNFDDFMTYTMADGWTALENNSGVYYRVVEDTDADQVFAVIKDNTVTVEDTVTKTDMANAENNNPTLKVTAYACQYVKSNSPTETAFTAAEAWANVKPATT